MIGGAKTERGREMREGQRERGAEIWERAERERGRDDGSGRERGKEREGQRYVREQRERARVMGAAEREAKRERGRDM